MRPPSIILALGLLFLLTAPSLYAWDYSSVDISSLPPVVPSPVEGADLVKLGDSAYGLRLESNITLYKTITQSNVPLAGGTLLAPHLYNWYFDGVDDYIVFPNNDGIDYGRFGDYWETTIMFKYNSGYYGFEKRIGYYAVGIAGWNINLVIPVKGGLSYGNSSSYYCDGCLVYSPNYDSSLFHNITITYDFRKPQNINVSSYFDGSYYVSYNVSDKITQQIENTAPLTLGSNPYHTKFWHGYMSFILFKNLNTKVITFLADATFYNGTVFFDLANQFVVGTPYGGVARVRANNTWLWVVEGGRNDSLIHLDWFPVGSHVYFYQGDTLVRDVYVNGTVNGVGLVEDTVVNLTAGNYTIKAYIPVGHVVTPHLYDNGSPASQLYLVDNISDSDYSLHLENIPYGSIVELVSGSEEKYTYTITSKPGPDGLVGDYTIDPLPPPGNYTMYLVVPAGPWRCSTSLERIEGDLSSTYNLFHYYSIGGGRIEYNGSGLTWITTGDTGYTDIPNPGVRASVRIWVEDPVFPRYLGGLTYDISKPTYQPVLDPYQCYTVQMVVPHVYVNYTTPNLPELPGVVGNFTSDWSKWTFGGFQTLLGGLLVASVYLGTRSVSAAAVAIIIVSILVHPGWLYTLLGIAVGGLLYMAWRRSGE